MTRFRTDSIPQAPGRLVRKNQDGVVVEERSIEKPPLLRRVTHDTVIPDYHLRKARGEIFNNKFNSTKVEFTATDEYSGVITNTDIQSADYGKSSSSIWSNGGSFTNLYNTGQLVFPVPELDPLELQRLQQEVIGGVNSTDIDLAAFAGEWGKTRALHRDLGHALLKLATEGAKVKVRRGSFKKIPLYDDKGRPLLNKKGQPRYRYSSTRTEVGGDGMTNVTRNAANLYLAGRMGLVPLLSDLEGACKALGKFWAPRRTSRVQQTVAGTARTTKVFADIPDVDWTVRLQSTKLISLRLGILYESSVAGEMVAALGLSRPLTSVWNLVPWSFVVDWFLNVGSFLDSIQPSFASKTLAAWVSRHEVTTNLATVGEVFSGAVKHPFDPNTPTHQHRRHSWSGQLLEVRTVKSRDPWNPDLPIRPAFGSGFNNQRSFDFAALIAQRIRIKL